MFNRLRHLAARLGLLPPPRYPYPALDVNLRNGARLHLVASIHMGNAAMSPLPAPLLQRVRQAQALIVEADITRPGSDISSPPQAQPLSARLDAARYDALSQRCRETGLAVERMDDFPLWRCALLLQAQQAQQLGLCSEFGIDCQLLNCAHGAERPIVELEGADTQLEMLYRLPEQGRDLLDDTLRHWHNNARLLQTLIGWWLAPPPVLQTPLPMTFCPALADVLMVQRNRAWRQRLIVLPPGEYVVAVGALHLFGEQGLPDLLAPYALTA
ncbi:MULTISPECIES: TraB/GumN family protein [Edwardsiella]|uniref:TraB/GumN family protein n=2 Tax=Edwardsiella anguillarum TaxID=1821960 RepID=A0ABY8SJ54_9GAMM|nr:MULTISPECIES: TraB/GumN family protein [Edwardsiella]AKM48431.1 conjugal transfer protein TraB [Edwardsiella sp. EA181011]GAJ66329.1 protein GumN [Edwardsiella piscicida]AIJ09411.1 putative ligase ybaP [Edwardsiella anguillarum ET080813]AKR77228.1 TraB/GumN family protein [Edwardsiella sp. LADL05-105]KAB0590449.1 conjugal transfer protein TraB [Edwardsiella anguillarum]